MYIRSLRREKVQFHDSTDSPVHGQLKGDYTIKPVLVSIEMVGSEVSPRWEVEYTHVPV